MATQGQIIENPISGERVKWHLTAADTDGDRLRLEVWVRPGGGIPSGGHIHARSEECFELLAGTMGFRRGKQAFELTRGQRASVPAGVEHAWWNAGDDELHFMVDVTPAGRFEQLLETAFGVGREAHARGRKGLGLLQLAVMMNEFGSETRPARPPYWVQRPLFAALAVPGRMRGHRPVYEAYSGATAAESAR